MRALLYSSLFLLLIAGCAGETEPAAEPQSFGEAFTASDVQPAESLLATYNHDALSDSVSTTLRGTVNAVCQAKGCWMTIDAGNGEEMTVTFKDYGFFMPKDIDGQEVVMHGVAYSQLTPVDELRHYGEDAGQSEAEIALITEPRRELHFLADGVQLVP
ncbi:DUF4920 domain-containing protein [Lewinella sp. IMCC34191]|uniref:DUF4920 domain-containing protein n=1 Tax=Lewinella sp. IMCC34191 TaxID=2259172 RepID=UPI000E261533|nr:DUF4920 domain-containing protein [Lewinella sp. IMCC34191]